MRRFYFLSFLTLLCISVNGFAQNKPAWIGRVENKIKKTETVWKIDNTIEHGDGPLFSLSWRLKSGSNTASIELTDVGVISNSEETFAALVTSFDQGMGKNATKTEFENFGNQGYIWPNLNKDGWTMIKFRKGTIFVTVYAPSPATAKRFAHYVIEQMP